MIPKFRAWDKRRKEMWKVATLHIEDEYADLFKTNIYEKPFDNPWAKFEDLILMQSTGLKDLKGVEIYEGDIVQSTWYDVDNNPYKKKGEITFVGAQYVIVYDSQFDVETGEITYDAHSLTYAEDVEVIGNIYENPELLISGIE